MQKLFSESILQLLLILPLVLIWRDVGREKVKYIFLFCFFFLVNSVLLNLPNMYPFLDIVKSGWNWEGKIYAFTGSVLFYLIFRSYLSKENFITLNQKTGSLKYTLVLMVVLCLIYILSAFLFNKSEKFDLEALFFQITMPGLEEEFAFHGIMLGLLNTFLKRNIVLWKINFGNPGVWITGILFGLVHGFSLGEQWQLQFNYLNFLSTFNFGLLMGWMTLKARSILFPVLTHGLSDFLLHFVAMVK